MLIKAEHAFEWLKMAEGRAPSRVLIYIVYFAALGIVLVAGLWPFNFRPKNQVTWLEGKNGLQFNGRGMIIGELPLPPASTYRESRQPITIELRLRSFTEPRDYLPQFFTVLDENLDDEFFIGQWKSELVIRSRSRTRTAASRYREIGVRGAFSKGKEPFVAITSGDDGTVVYLDGSPAKILPRYFLLPPDMAERETLLIGNSANGKSGMKGIISGLAIYDRVLSASQIGRSFDSWEREGKPILGKDEGLAALYLFDEGSGNITRNHMKPGRNLMIPAVFRPLKRIILDIDLKRVGLNRGFLEDAVINIAGFIGFGFIQGMVFFSFPQIRRSVAFFLTLLSGSVVSMMIELTQVYLPTRDSDFIDWVCNTLGTLVAAIILSQLIENAQRR